MPVAPPSPRAAGAVLLLALGGWPGPRPAAALTAEVNASVFGAERLQSVHELLHHGGPKGTVAFYSANATTEALRRQWARPVLPKRVRNVQRLVFLAGLEGSGHHLWVPLFQKCGSAGRCKAAHDLAVQLWSQSATRGLWSFETKLYEAKKGPPGPQHWEYAPPDKQWLSDFQHAESKVRTALRRIRQSNAPGLFLANDFGRQSACGMMSYPNFKGAMKIFQTPDVRLLAELAEAESVDFRVLFLHRPAAALLRSTVISRHHNPWDPQAVVLEHSAQALRAQLQSLDPAFVLCTDYDRLPELPEGLEAFLGGAGLRRLFTRELESFHFRNRMAAEFHWKTQLNVSLSPEQRAGARFLQSAVDDLYRVAQCATARV